MDGAGPGIDGEDDEPRVASLDGDGALRLDAGAGARAQDPELKRPEANALGSDLNAIQTRFARDIISALWLPGELAAEQRAEAINAALLMFARLAPRDEAEAMLAVQMVA